MKQRKLKNCNNQCRRGSNREISAGAGIGTSGGTASSVLLRTIGWAKGN